MLAEIFFKFHSFTLECVAFLSTWYALSWMLARVFPLDEVIRHGQEKG